MLEDEGIYNDRHGSEPGKLGLRLDNKESLSTNTATRVDLTLARFVTTDPEAPASGPSALIWKLHVGGIALDQCASIFISRILSSKPSLRIMRNMDWSQFMTLPEDIPPGLSGRPSVCGLISA